jgi:nucleoside-diphosphate-sugar epimerase
MRHSFLAANRNSTGSTSRVSHQTSEVLAVHIAKASQQLDPTPVVAELEDLADRSRVGADQTVDGAAVLFGGMRVVVIGGTGHIGTYLVPGLMKAGHDTAVISRGSRRPYCDDPVWRDVEMVACDREAAEQDGEFGSLVAGLRADAVVDLTCFTRGQARQLVDALDGQHVVHTGSVWSYGPSALVPTTEDAPKHPYGAYGVNKLDVEQYLTGEQDRVRASVVHPGHISGPGWMPIGPAGNLDPGVIDSLRADGSVLLPDRGGETIHHVHAEDVARLHQACLEKPEVAAGQSFNSVCTRAFTLRGYAEVVARHFGHVPRLEFVPWDEFVTRVDAEHAETTLEHIGRAPLYSMEKARSVLGFLPKHDVTSTVLDSIDAWLAANRN